jgi:hypothetical protein
VKSELIDPDYFYFIDDGFFDLVNDKNLKINKTTTDRPHYLPFKDKNIPSLLWMIPCSSQVNKYKKIKGKHE